MGYSGILQMKNEELLNKIGHDDNYHKYIAKELRSIKRTERRILKKLFNLPCQHPDKKINTVRRIDTLENDAKWIAVFWMFLAGLISKMVFWK